MNAPHVPIAPRALDHGAPCGGPGRCLACSEIERLSELGSFAEPPLSTWRLPASRRFPLDHLPAGGAA